MPEVWDSPIAPRCPAEVSEAVSPRWINCIELNRTMMHYWDDVSVRDILLHEMLHKICYQRLDDYHGEHGQRFEKMCQDLGLPDHIAKERTD